MLTFIKKICHTIQSSRVFLILFFVAMILIVVMALILFLMMRMELKRAKKRKGRKKRKPNEKGPLPVGKLTVGKVHNQGSRPSQQDSFGVSASALVESHGLLMVVADGMGGLENGDQISQLAVQTILDQFLMIEPGSPAICKLLYLLQRATNTVNSFLGPENLRKSGSTLVMGLVQDNELSFLSVGDSRIALLRDGSLMQLNREHVYKKELLLDAINRGTDIGDAFTNEQGGGLISFLGIGQLKYFDIPEAPMKLRAGDKVILMSDGVYNALEEQELVECLSAPVTEATEKLEQLILEKKYSNQDNFTALILECGYEQKRDSDSSDKKKAKDTPKTPVVDKIPATIDP